MADEMNGEREAFESWAISSGFPIRRLHNPEAGRDYGIDDAQDAWEAWQARASLSANAGCEPVAYCSAEELQSATENGDVFDAWTKESTGAMPLYAHPSPPEGIAGWTKASEQLPPCRDDQDYIGINTAGFAGVFNAVADIAGNVYCMMETAEESVAIMSDLDIWKPFIRPLPASPTIGGESNGG